MKKIFLLWFLLFFLYSCWKENIDNKINLIEELDNNITFYPSSENCWIISCDLQKYLEKKLQKWDFKIDKLDYFEKRLSILLMRFKDRDLLLKNKDFKNFVDEFYKEFFYWDNIYSYDEQNFIWYIYLPRMVANTFENNNIIDDNNFLESILNSIKERYFITSYEKEVFVKNFKNNINEIIKNINLKNINKENLKIDENYFNEIFLTPNSWLYDKIMSPVLDLADMLYWDEILLKELKEYSLNQFFIILNNLNIEKKLFFEIMWNSEENISKLEQKINFINNKYQIFSKIPNDRYLRHDEIIKYIIWNIDEFNKNWNFNKDILDIKHFILLQFSYENSQMQTMSWRLNKYNSINNFIIENLFKYSKWLPKDINLNY